MLPIVDDILLFRPTEALYVCLGLVWYCVVTLIVCFVALCFVVALLPYCLLVSCIDSHCLVMPYLVLFIGFGLGVLVVCDLVHLFAVVRFQRFT